jgi:very-short-patch-repair endonuclease
MWNEKHLKKLVANGKIRGYSLPKKKEQPPAGRIVAKHFKKRSKALDWIGWNLVEWCKGKGVVLLEEYRFDENKRWRFDWAIESLKVAVEFEGGVFQQNSGHKTAKHYTKDTNKYNRAAQLGWKVLRFTAVNYESLIEELNACV